MSKQINVCVSVDHLVHKAVVISLLPRSVPVSGKIFPSTTRVSSERFVYSHLFFPELENAKSVCMSDLLPHGKEKTALHLGAAPALSSNVGLDSSLDILARVLVLVI